MATLLVTGGAGFIGSNFVRHVLSRGDERVVVVDKLTYAGCRESLSDLEGNERFTFVQADIADREAIESLFQREAPDLVVNFAAETHVDRSIDGPDAFIRTNIVGTFVLLDVARASWGDLERAGRDGKRFLHVSTDEVYGSLGPEGLFHETTPYAPNSPYAASKASADHLVRAWCETYRMPTLLTNCSNNYGPFQFPEKLIPLMTLNALEAKSLPIYGDGGNIRDWLFVEDHCDAILTVLRRGTLGEKYNVGGNAERSNLQVMDSILAAVESFVPAAGNPAMQARGLTDYAELKTFVKDRAGHDRRYAIDFSKLRESLGWQPTCDFEAGIRNTVRWYLDHRDWCELVQAQGQYQRERLGKV